MKCTTIRKYLLLTPLAATFAMASLTAAHAQPKDQPPCPRDQQHCEQPQPRENSEKQDNHTREQPARQTRHEQPQRQQPKVAENEGHAPRAGDSSRSGRPFERAANSRVSAPPRGQEYRVVDDYLVLSDSDSQKIVNVVGPVSNFLN